MSSTSVTPAVSSHGPPQTDPPHMLDRQSPQPGPGQGDVRLTARRGALYSVAPQVPGLHHNGHRGEVTGPQVRGGPTRLRHSAPQGQVSGWHQMKILRHSQGLGLGTTCKFQLAMPSHRESEPSRILGRTPCCPARLSTAKGCPEPGRGGQRMGCRPQPAFPASESSPGPRRPSCPGSPASLQGRKRPLLDDWALKLQMCEDSGCRI